MELPPELKRFLERLGVNTTRLQWRLYEMEKRRGEPRYRLPAALRALGYRHKFCPSCHGLVARNERVCPSCGSNLPHPAIYKLLRAIGLVVPEGAAIVTFGFVVVMLVLYVVSIYLDGPGAIMAPNDATLMKFGALDANRVLDHGEYWRIFGFGLFHIGLIHIGFNSIALVQAGPLIESEIGGRRMLVLITISQITAALAVLYGSSFGRAVGASGWLFGLIGFGVSYYHRHGGSRRELRNFFVQWAIYAFFFGVLIRASNLGHFGGLVGGFVLGLTADLSRARRTLWTTLWDWLFWPCLGLWGATLFFLIRSVVTG